MTVRVTPEVPRPTEGYRWAFNKLGPYIENERTGDVTRLPDWHGPVPPAPRWHYPVWLMVVPTIVFFLVLLGWIAWRIYVK